MGPHLRTFAVALGAGALAFALATSCFQAAPLEGPYRCDDGRTCPDGLTCDDGICCIDDAGADPECPSTLTRGGRCTDGGTPRVYFEDLDFDGYGANDAGHLSCREPASFHFAVDAGDCDDLASAIHPGAPDVCDGKDNDCNRQIDEPPFCGGPRSLFTTPGVTSGAKKLADQWLSGTPPPRCVRDDPADSSGPADVYDPVTGLWHGARSTTHVFWAQAPAGTTWDLSGANEKLRLLATVQANSANELDGGYIWVDTGQPWIVLCGPAGFLRLAPEPSAISLPYGGPYDITETFPVRGGVSSSSVSTWTIQPGSATDVDAVLRQVEHIEVLVELNPAVGGPSFDIDFDTAFMGFQ